MHARGFIAAEAGSRTSGERHAGDIAIEGECSQPGAELGPNPKSFGHPGAGGSLGFADPQARIGFGYTMNKMNAGVLIDPRATALIDAAYASP